MSILPPTPQQSQTQRSQTQRSQIITPLERLRKLLPDLFEPTQQSGELLLRFQLGATLQAAISLERVVEAIQIPVSSVTPIPNMPPATLGLMSAKGKIFWAVDLAQLLTLSVPQRQLASSMASSSSGGSRRHEVIIIQSLALQNASDTSLLLGLVVSQIRGTLRVDSAAIAYPDHEVSPELKPFVQGQISQGEETLRILSVDAILNAPGLVAS
ncbi:MAG: hypothetical protein HC771_12585 [Synechococcales cyanobacterium CRU_2_2]|nr:hypothetical protein [Synechococcales cyanobacterium CRU_2_2]